MVAVENLADYLLEQIKTKKIVRVPASEAEYLDIAPEFSPLYKDVSTVQFALLVSQTCPFVSMFERTDKPDVWLNTDYKTLDSVAKLGGLSLPVREVYHKIQFPQA